MKIEDRQTGSLGGLQPGRVQDTERASRVSGAGDPPAGGDRLELSSLAGRIRTELDTIAVRQQARVESLARQYQAGRYRLDSGALGRALLAAGPEM